MEYTVEALIPFYFLLNRYYQGDFNWLDKKTRQELLEMMKKEALYSQESVSKGMKHLLDADERDWERLEYDFNRLFIGPGKLEAPPYESCYLNDDQTLMQKDTLKVRQCYLDEDLQVSNKNVEPDDHIRFEIEFLIQMLLRDDEKSEAAHNKFLREHIFKWYAPHVKDIKKHSKNEICLGMADILEGVFDTAKKLV
jgi:TorA maturation chaperone TorD